MRNNKDLNFRTAPPPEVVAALRKAGLRTQMEIAAALGVSQPTVSAWESGAQTMTLPIRLLAERLFADRS